jgi:hypothetical protein
VGFRFRRSVRILPGVKVNLGKRGASLSLGGRGFTYNVSAKGTRTTVGIPGTGLSWSTYSPYSKPATHEAPSSPKLVSAEPGSRPSDSQSVLVPISSSPAEQIAAFSTSELAPLLNSACRLRRFRPIVITELLVLVLAAWLAKSALLAACAIFFGALFLPASSALDRYRRSVAIGYRLTDLAGEIADALWNAFQTLATCHRLWSIRAEGHTTDWKRNAGATTLSNRTRIYLDSGKPDCIRASVSFPRISLGSNSLYFLPDAALVVTKSSVAALHYRDLELATRSQRFIEEEMVPNDTAIVGRTWRFVNKNGGPDRRFNGNRELPVCMYGELDLRSVGGLNARVQFSKADAADQLATLVRALGSHISTQMDLNSITFAELAHTRPTILFWLCQSIFILCWIIALYSTIPAESAISSGPTNTSAIEQTKDGSAAAAIEKAPERPSRGVVPSAALPVPIVVIPPVAQRRPTPSAVVPLPRLRPLTAR